MAAVYHMAAMNIGKIKEALKDEPKYRMTQVMKAIFSDLIDDWDKATALPLPLREKLKKSCRLNIKAEILKDEDSSKALIILEDGNKIETVLMHGQGRNAVCVSCQVGCPLKCEFCATGRLGLTRSLTASEIVEQVLLWARTLKPAHEHIDNVTFMGMGEPFLNYDNVIEAIKILNNKNGFNLGARHISISTSGIIEGIDRLSEEPLQLNLALSLHAPNTTLRSQLMPINKTYDIDKVLAAVKNYIDKTNRKVMIEYVMIAGVNDSQQHAKELVAILKKHLGKPAQTNSAKIQNPNQKNTVSTHLFMVNLIEYNPTDRFKSSPRDTISKFKQILVNEGIQATQRFKFGRRLFGACGQLAGKK